MNRLEEKIKRSYMTLYARRHLIARDLKMSDQEYRLWDLYVAIYDWDKRHYKYGYFEATDREIAPIIGWDYSTVARYRKKLIKKNIISRAGQGIYKLLINPQYRKNIPEENINDNFSSRNNSEEQKVAELQQGVASTQQVVADMQQNRSYSSFIKYPVKDMYSYVNVGSRLSESQYKTIKKEVNNLSIFLNGKWFDKNGEIQKLCNEQQRLAQLMLDYEIENDLLPL